VRQAYVLLRWSCMTVQQLELPAFGKAVDALVKAQLELLDILQVGGPIFLGGPLNSMQQCLGLGTSLGSHEFPAGS
jgi:hypothetical protein